MCISVYMCICVFTYIMVYMCVCCACWGHIPLQMREICIFVCISRCVMYVYVYNYVYLGIHVCLHRYMYIGIQYMCVCCACWGHIPPQMIIIYVYVFTCEYAHVYVCVIHSVFVCLRVYIGIYMCVLRLLGTHSSADERNPGWLQASTLTPLLATMLALPIALTCNGNWK